MDKRIRIGKRYVGEGEKTFVVAEVSANHLQDYGRAEAIIKAAAQAGADAVKLQTYTPDTITLDCDNDYFQITQGTIWDGTTLHKLYEEAYTPWEWQPRLMEYANGLGLECFSSPFDATAVDFMKEMDMPLSPCLTLETFRRFFQGAHSWGLTCKSRLDLVPSERKTLHGPWPPSRPAGRAQHDDIIF